MANGGNLGGGVWRRARWVMASPLCRCELEEVVGGIIRMLAARSSVSLLTATTFLHSHWHGLSDNPRGEAVVDIFRLEGGKVLEHWDVIQPIPEKSANANTMF
jgi:hypothetical protein